jgi:hypothetical protein
MDKVSDDAWQPMNTFPRDGRLVEVKNYLGETTTAHWREGRVYYDNIVLALYWREM